MIRTDSTKRHHLHHHARLARAYSYSDGVTAGWWN